MPTQVETIASLERRLTDLLPGFSVEVERPPRTAPWDLMVKVKVAGKTRRIICEVKSVGEPRYLAQAITTLKGATQNDPRLYPLVAAPYISPEGQRLCRDAGIGFIDLTGNAFVQFNGVLLDRASAAPPPRAKGRLKRLFAPRSTRIIRVVLEQPEATWTMPRLAKEAGVSLRTVHLVLNALDEKAFIVKRRGAITLQKPGDLLDLWAQNYSVADLPRRTFYSFIKSPNELAMKLSEYAIAQKEALALTLHSGASFVAPFVRSPDVHAYFAGEIASLQKALDLRPVESGGTIHLLEPFDEGVFYRVQTIRGARVVCNTQLYLDLVNYPARGREQADELRRQKLRF